MTEQTQERERDLDRLLTFVDAIVAIAITLLVLPLVELTAELDREEPLGDIIGDHASDVWSFFLSFFVIAQLWSAQHRAVSHLLRDHPRVNRLLILWSVTIVFLPFPTALIAKTVESPSTKILYVGTIAVSSVLVGLIDLTIARHPELTDGLPPSPVAAFSTVVVLLVALGLMLLLPGISYWPMLLLVLSGDLTRLVRRALDRRGSG